MSILPELHSGGTLICLISHFDVYIRIASETGNVVVLLVRSIRLMRDNCDGDMNRRADTDCAQ